MGRIYLVMAMLLAASPVDASSSRVLVQLFEWSWSDIATECEQVLGPRGYRGVQVSPPNEHAVLPGNFWYDRYQPVSYLLESRGGTEAQFAAMVKRCKASGVDVYVDAVLNHTAWNPEPGKVLRGSAGSEYGAFDFPDYPGIEYFHRCRGGDDDDIRDWSNRTEIFRCNLALLPDLNTAHPHVVKILGAYLSKLVDIGVAGLRVDAAKHIEPLHLQKILGDHFPKEHIYQEVIDLGLHEAVKATEYLATGKVINFRYGRDLGRIFRGGKLSWLEHFGDSWGYSPSEQSVVFLDNHDTQRGHGPSEHVLNYKDGALYSMATAFMLAWPYGQPVVMSGYAFEHPNEGPPERGTAASRCDDARWICEHRNERVAPLVKLRGKYQKPFVTGWWSNGSNAVAFSRDNQHLFIFNRESMPLRVIPSNLGLEPGTYRSSNGQLLQITSDHQQISVDVLPQDFATFHKL